MNMTPDQWNEYVDSLADRARACAAEKPEDQGRQERLKSYLAYCEKLKLNGPVSEH